MTEGLVMCGEPMLEGIFGQAYIFVCVLVDGNCCYIYTYIYICGSSDDFTCNYIKQEVLHYTEIINLLHARHTFAI